MKQAKKIFSYQHCHDFAIRKVSQQDKLYDNAVSKQNTNQIEYIVYHRSCPGYTAALSHTMNAWPSSYQSCYGILKVSQSKASGLSWQVWRQCQHLTSRLREDDMIGKVMCGGRHAGYIQTMMSLFSRWMCWGVMSSFTQGLNLG